MAGDSVHCSDILERIYDIDWPARELFMWAVLMRRRDIAMLFLQEEKVNQLILS